MDYYKSKDGTNKGYDGKYLMVYYDGMEFHRMTEGLHYKKVRLHVISTGEERDEIARGVDPNYHFYTMHRRDGTFEGMYVRGRVWYTDRDAIGLFPMTVVGSENFMVDEKVGKTI